MTLLFAAIAIFIIEFLSVIALVVPGLVIGLVVGHLFSRSLRHTRRISNDAFLGAVGFAGGYLGSIFYDLKFQHNGAFGCAMSLSLVFLYEVYLSWQNSRDRLRTSGQ